MEKKTLSDILHGKIFQVPDYQRGYAWEQKQWNDFLQDIDALIDEQITNHYTGTIVIYQPQNKPTENYGPIRLEKVDIVDGQQRLTTCCLYLSIILNQLIKEGKDEFNSFITNYLFYGNKSKLRLNNETTDYFFDLISTGASNVTPNSIQEKRLQEAYNYLKQHITLQKKSRGINHISYLTELFDAITRKLNFSFYPIEVESEIGMTFELMNSRGKDLSSLELLKNYLMYWVYRNVPDISIKEDITAKINKTWKQVFINIARSNGSESQCLRIAWTLYINYTPKNWNGYAGFKSDEVLPLRNFQNTKKREEVLDLLNRFVEGLALVSKHYSAIIFPEPNDESINEFKYLTKIINAGNTANYLPLLVAARIHREKSLINDDQYIDLLKAIEIFSFRVFLWENRRSNAGITSFYRWADDLFSGRHNITSIIEWILGTVNWYSNENKFRKSLDEDFYDWYRYKRLLKYTLFEYELYLLNDRNKPKINWEDLSDSTIEHIFPQTPKEESEWLKKWSQSDIKIYLNDISNLVLTKDNSRYKNFEFNRKKGEAGKDYCYSNSDIKQERKIAEYSEWTVESCKKRRAEIIDWIITRWGINKHLETIVNENEEDDNLIFDDKD